MTKKINVALIPIMEYIAMLLNYHFEEQTLDKVASDSIDSGKFMLPGG